MLGRAQKLKQAFPDTISSCCVVRVYKTNLIVILFFFFSKENSFTEFLTMFPQ